MVAEVSNALFCFCVCLFFFKPRFSVLVRRKDCWASRLGLVYWPFLLGCGEERKDFIYWNSSQHPPLFPVLFQKPLFFGNQRGSLLFPDLYIFDPFSAKSRHLFFEYFHFSYSMKIPPIKSSPCGLFNNLIEGEGILCSVLGIPTDSDGT